MSTPAADQTRADPIQRRPRFELWPEDGDPLNIGRTGMVRVVYSLLVLVLALSALGFSPACDSFSCGIFAPYLHRADVDIGRYASALWPDPATLAGYQKHHFITVCMSEVPDEARCRLAWLTRTGVK